MKYPRIHVPYLIIVEFVSFTKSQFTAPAQHVLHLYKCAIKDQGLAHPFRGSRAGEYGLTGIVNALVKCLFRTGAEHTRVCKCPHVRKSKRIEVGRTWGPYLEN